MNRIPLFFAALGAFLMIGCAGTGSGELESSACRSHENQMVSSADGTRIGFTKIGSGPVPVVIVHGALNSGEQWLPVATAMVEHCTCYVMDRWGRGRSELRTEYSLEREVEDISAVLELAGPDAFLLGHSSGAIYALEAARRIPIEGMVLYEPPLNAFHGRFVEDILPPIRTAKRDERHEDVVSIFLRDEAQLPESEISFLREIPLWGQMVALAPQSVREWEELADAGLTVERYRDVVVPTLLLTGTYTRDHPSFATKALETMLPKSRTATLEGQGHGANLGAPEMVAEDVINFILETSR